MAPRKQKIDYGEKTGVCTICNINLWSDSDNKPAIFPCNIEGCPYEDAKDQNRDDGFERFSSIGSGLGQID